MANTHEQIDEANERLLEDEQDLAPPQSPCHRLLWSLSLFMTICITFLVGFAVGRDFQQTSINQLCFTLMAKRSPIPTNLASSWHETQFNGSLLKETEYQRRAGPEVDKVWEALGINYNSIAVPAAMAEIVGLSEDQVKVREKYGGGYVANVEGLHHLHCLNLLRQALFWNFEYYHSRGEGAFQNDDAIVEKHVTHCLDIIRQQLQCTMDIGVMGQIWYQPSPGQKPEPFVDFNTRHMCRNFEDIRRWAFQHQIREPTPYDLLEPPSGRVYQEIP